MVETYYDLLGIARDASTDEVRVAYRERLKESHPDVNDAKDASHQTRRIIEAEEVLTDPAERERYDELGHEQYLARQAGPAGAAGKSGDAGHGADTPGSGDAGHGADTPGSGDAGHGADTPGSGDAGHGADTPGSGDAGHRADTPGSGGDGEEASRGSGSPGGGSSRSGSSGETTRNTTDGGRHSSWTERGWEDTSRGGEGTGRRTEHSRDRTDRARGQAGTAADFDGTDWQETRRAERQPRGGSYATEGENWRTWDSDRSYAVGGSSGGFLATGEVPDSGTIITLLAIFLIYPVLLWGAMTPAFPLVVNAAMVLFAVVIVAFLQSVPTAAVSIFGVWTVALPLGLVAVAGVDPISLVGLVVLLGVVLPLCFSLLVRSIVRF